MTRERLIWRPNEIPLNAWEAMSREEQIAWWQAQEEPPEPKGHMKEAISMYEDGIVTLSGFFGLVYKLAVPEEIDEFMRVCPPDILAKLKASLASYGDDETTWPRMFYSASHYPWVTPEEIEQSHVFEQQRVWDGVRLLKNYLAKS